MASSLYKQSHHQRIDQVLSALDRDLLGECKCYFGVGTAIALLLDEYRESMDIDFVCSDKEGFRRLRNLVSDIGLGRLLKEGMDVELTRGVRRDQYGVRTWVCVDHTDIKLEFIQEARIPIDGSLIPALPVAVLARTGLYAEKLLANADRWPDASILYRDIIDLAAMTAAWGPPPEAAWLKAKDAYGESVERAFEAAQAHLRIHPDVLTGSFERMGISGDWQDRIRDAIGIASTDAEPDCGPSI